MKIDEILTSLYQGGKRDGETSVDSSDVYDIGAVPDAKQAILEAILEGFPKEFSGDDFALAPSFRNHDCPDKGDLQIWTFGYNHALKDVKEYLRGMFE